MVSALGRYLVATVEHRPLVLAIIWDSVQAPDPEHRFFGRISFSS